MSRSHNGAPPPARVAGEPLDALERSAGELAVRMTECIRSEIAEYGVPAARALTPQIEEHCHEHLAAFVAWARAGCRPGALDLGFVRERAALRAAGPVPLGALLRSYLIGQREIWRTLTAASGASADAESVRELTAATFEYTGMITAVVAEAYTEAGARMAAHAEFQKRELLELLLAGAPLPDPLADLAAALELPGSSGLAVAVLRPAAGEAEEDRAEALVADVRRRLAAGGGSGLVCRRAAGVVALLPLGEREARRLLEEVCDAIGGPDAPGLLAGLGFPAPDLASIPPAHADAMRALRHATPERPVVALADVRLVEHLAAGADAGAARLVPPAVIELLERDRATGGVLEATLSAFAGEGMNVSRAAASLFVHPNTVRYRLGRVRATTELDPARFEDLEELLAAIRLTPR